MPGAADRILRTLEAFGFDWDGPILRQSSRHGTYAAVLATLLAQGRLFACDCSRRGRAAGRGTPYPGTCRSGARRVRAPYALRLRIDPCIVAIDDLIQGEYRQDLAASGDFIVKRRDGIIAYPLAVVVDDAAQGVTDIVRGADLLESTPQQRFLQSLLSLPAPRYAHLPVLTEPGGAKLAKSRRSVALNTARAPSQLATVFRLLGLEPPAELAGGTVHEAWAWAIARWDPGRVPKGASLAAPAP